MIRSQLQSWSGLCQARRAVTTIEAGFIIATAVLIGLANITLLGSKLGAKFSLVAGYLT